MSREEVILLMGTLQVAYPKFYTDMTKKQAEMTVDLWAAMLSDITAEYGISAVSEIIKTSKWHPTIAEVRTAAIEIEKMKRFDMLNKIKDEQMTLVDKDNETFKRIMAKGRFLNES